MSSLSISLLAATACLVGASKGVSSEHVAVSESSSSSSLAQAGRATLRHGAKLRLNKKRAAGKGLAQGAACTGKTYDYLMLVEQWCVQLSQPRLLSGETLCGDCPRQMSTSPARILRSSQQRVPCRAITECMDGVFQCTASNLFFTMHGLWPENSDGSYPCTCTDETFDISKVKSIESDMNTYWPSLNGPNDTFWKHEYEKHGTCAEDLFPTEFAFFNGTLALRAQYDAVKALAAAGYKPSNSKGFTLSAFRKAMGAAYGTYPAVTCDKSGNIEGITWCIDKTLSAMPCPSATPDACSASTLYLPASMHAKGVRGQ